MDKIDKSDYDNWQEMLDEAKKIAPPLEDRIDYIVKTIAKAYNAKISTWYFEGADKGSTGNIMDYIDDDYVFGLEVEFEFDDVQHWTNYNTNKAILTNEGEINLLDNFPKRWIFEDFEKELINGLQAFTDKVEAKNKKDEALIATATAKLSDEELRALLESKK